LFDKSIEYFPSLIYSFLFSLCKIYHLPPLEPYLSEKKFHKISSLIDSDFLPPRWMQVSAIFLLYLQVSVEKDSICTNQPELLVAPCCIAS
jgi:hypothetical protein